MYRKVTESSTHWTGGSPPPGRTCEQICHAASGQAHYDHRCEGDPEYLVLIAATTSISGCTPVKDAAGHVTGCEGTAKTTTTEIYTGTRCPWEPPPGGGGLATSFDKALEEVKKIEEEAERELKKAKK